MSRQRFLAAMLGALALATVLAGAVSAAHVARMEVNPAQVAPGGEVAVFGTPSWAPVPVKSWPPSRRPPAGTPSGDRAR